MLPVPPAPVSRFMIPSAITTTNTSVNADSRLSRTLVWSRTVSSWVTTGMTIAPGGPAQDTAQQQPMQPRALQNPDEEGRRRERGHRERGHGKHQCGGRFLGNLGNLHVEAAVKQDDQERESPEIRGKSFDVGARGQLQDRPQENT